QSALETFAFCDERASPDQAFGTNGSTVENLGAHADQAIVGDRAAMKDRLVADGDPGANGQRCAGIGMIDGTVLDIAVMADDDRRVVGANDRAEPDAGAPAEADIADEVGGRRRPGVLGE